MTGWLELIPGMLGWGVSRQSLVLEYADGELRTSMPLPAHAVSIVVDGGMLNVEQLLPPQEERVVGMHPRRRDL